MKEVLQDLRELSACVSALEWVRRNSHKTPMEHRTPMELWYACSVPNWLMWLLFRKSEESGWPDAIAVRYLLCDVVEEYAVGAFKQSNNFKNIAILKAGLDASRKYLRGEYSTRDLYASITLILSDVLPSSRSMECHACCAVCEAGDVVVTKPPYGFIRAHNAVCSTVDAFVLGSLHGDFSSVQKDICDFVRGRVSVPL